MDVLFFGVILGGGVLLVILLPLLAAIFTDPAKDERK